MNFTLVLKTSKQTKAGNAISPLSYEKILVIHLDKCKRNKESHYSITKTCICHWYQIQNAL